MSDEKTKKIDIKAQVAARVQEESASLSKEEDQKAKKFPLDFLMTCLRGNRVGDANLYAAINDLGIAEQRNALSYPLAAVFAPRGDQHAAHRLTRLPGAAIEAAGNDPDRRFLVALLYGLDSYCYRRRD